MDRLVSARGSDKRLQMGLLDLSILLLRGLVGETAATLGKAPSSMELLTSRESSGFIIFMELA